MNILKNMAPSEGMEDCQAPPKAMICRRVVGPEGVAKIVLEPVEEPTDEPEAQKQVTDEAEQAAKQPKPYISCEKCGKKFYVIDTTYKRTPKERLSLHMITEHDKERLYQCPYDGCFKAYNTVKLLQQHKVVHTNRKKHSCTECSKQFYRKTHLLAHLRRHTSNPKFKPRASRRNMNPYVQFQKKKEDDQDESSETEQPIRSTEPVITEDELIELRRAEAEMAEREVMESYKLDHAADEQQLDDFRDETLDDLDFE